MQLGGLGRQLAIEPAKIELKRGHGLPQLIVQLARDALALVFTGVLQRHRQLAQPRRVVLCGARCRARGCGCER